MMMTFTLLLDNYRPHRRRRGCRSRRGVVHVRMRVPVGHVGSPREMVRGVRKPPWFLPVPFLFLDDDGTDDRSGTVDVRHREMDVRRDRGTLGRCRGWRHRRPVPAAMMFCKPQALDTQHVLPFLLFCDELVDSHAEFERVKAVVVVLGVARATTLATVCPDGTPITTLGARVPQAPQATRLT